MLKHCIKTAQALKRLRADKDGVVSFEYIIVAAAFGTGAAGGIGTALTNGLTAITAAFTAAV